MNMPPKPKSPWRWLRRILITLAVLATLIGIFYTEEDVRGKIEWEHYRQTLLARGEKLDVKDLIPPPVPDDENFFAAPFFQSGHANNLTIYGKNLNTAPGMGYWAEAKMTDLKKWQDYYRHSPKEFPTAPQAQTPAADVLLAMSKNDSGMAELRQAAERPYANMPLNYEDLLSANSDLIHYFQMIKQCAQVLEMRAIAELANGRSDEALADVKLMFRLDDSIRTQPFLISHLVHIAILQITLQPIWEGTVSHQWTDGQLAEIEAELVKLDCLADYQQAIHGELIFDIEYFENQRITRKYEYLDNDGKTNVVPYTLMPASFFYQNELTAARLDQEWALPLVDTNAHTASPEKLRQANQYVQAQLGPFSPYKTLALSSFSAVGGSVKRFAFAQAGIDLARVASALERYHLAHGQYPDTLDALTPAYLDKIPNDVIGGKPLHYQRTDDGKFLLYSVGWNEKDDGGQIGLTKQGNMDITKGDWVWPTTAK